MPIRAPGLAVTTTPCFRSILGFIENSGSMPRCTFGRLRNGASRGSSSCTVLLPTCTSRKSSAFRFAAHDETSSIRLSVMRRRYLPSLPGAPCATTAMRCNAGCTGVAGSALLPRGDLLVELRQHLVGRQLAEDSHPFRQRIAVESDDPMRAGRIEPGSWVAVFTGQAEFSSPALTAFTSARLSFFVRPFTEGTVTGGSFAVESLPALLPVLEAAGVVDELGEAAAGTAGTPWVVATATVDSAGGICSAPGDGRASLLAAQPSRAMTRRLSKGMDEYRRKGCISSTEELAILCLGFGTRVIHKPGRIPIMRLDIIERCPSCFRDMFGLS